MALVFSIGFAGTMVAPPHRPAYALVCKCSINPGCNILECTAAKLVIKVMHDLGEKMARIIIRGPFHRYRDWVVDKFFKKQFIDDLMKMAQQMSAVGMHQAYIIGTLLDAKHQLETERIFLQMENEAHRDYQPSRDFCSLGTNVRSMAHSEQKGKFNAEALSERQIQRHLRSVSMAGSVGVDQDRESRWRQFTSRYCDSADNNGGNSAGLGLVCGGAGDRVNRDIDFTRLIDHPRTLELDFTGGTSEDAKDVMAMSSNLYGHDILTRSLTPEMMSNREYQHLYMKLRSVATQRSVAENSFDAIVGLKSSGTTDVGEEGEQTRNFLGAVMSELGVPDDEIYKVIGENPSYYAQLEILAKKIYQNTDFYADLYDKPANVARKKVALKAIGLMLDRALYESELRQEMMTSVLLSARLRQRFKDVESALPNTGD
ncbi:MAG: hypothetical protein K9G62_03355 [Alphaproteobacteria bacterium]|nr:hypothetical protein [Alphaproteobacteria bacterium]